MAYGHRTRYTPEPVPITNVVIFPVNAVVGARRLSVPIGPGPQSICTVEEGHIVFPPPLQDQIGISVSAACDCGSFDVHQWNR